MLQVMKTKMTTERKKDPREVKNKLKPVPVHQLESKRKKKNLANNKKMLLKSNHLKKETPCSAKKNSSKR